MISGGLLVANSRASNGGAMKRTRKEREADRLLGPAAAAMRRNRHTVFRDAREASDQVTAEKLLNDAAAMQRFHTPSSKGAQARLLIYSPEELAVYRQKTRAEMETKVKRGYKFLGNWTKYARWEAQQKAFERMRDVLQRAVQFHGDDPILWRDYAELEAANGFVREARAVWSRGVTSLPASTDLWMKYLAFEQAAASAGSASPAGASVGPATATAPAAEAEATVRDVFNRWLAVPTSAPPVAYELYALFEVQCGSQARCRDVIRRYVERYNSVEAWLFAGHVELQVFGDGDRAVRVLRTAMEALPEELLSGPVECRVPLALADALALTGRVSEARRQYQELLAAVSGGGGESSSAGIELAAASAAPSAAAATAAIIPRGAERQRTVSFALVDDVLTAYSRFERLHADSTNHEHLSRLEAQKAYERRIAADPQDWDAWLSFYLLLREAAAAHAPSQPGKEGADASGAPQPPQRLEEQAVLCLSKALATPVRQREEGLNPYAAQQRAVLVMEYAKVCEAAGQVELARRTLEDEIRAFPFELASCPRLWLEAAAFEERQGNLDTARTLLSAGTKKTREDVANSSSQAGAAAAHSRDPSPKEHPGSDHHHSRLLFNAALQLEERAMQRGLCSREEYLHRVRTSYQEALRTSPLDERLWFSFAKLEEKEGQLARAQALYSACARTLTAEACKTRSFARRYAILAVVDKTWAKRIALQVKHVKRMRAKGERRKRDQQQQQQTNSENVGDDEGVDAEAVAAAEKELRDLYAALLKSVWEDYTHEALAWRRAYLAAAAAAAALAKDSEESHRAENPEAASVAVPAALPEALGPARARWSDAVSAVADYLLDRSGATTPLAPLAPLHSDENADGVRAMRDLFVKMAEEERAVLRRTLGWDEDTSFDASQSLSRWVELLLSPLTADWATFEATHGGSLGVVQQHVTAPAAAAAQRRRTRLLRNRK